MMSLENNCNFGVPIGSPDANHASRKKSMVHACAHRRFWKTAGVLALAVVVVVCIAAPLAAKNNSDNMTSTGVEDGTWSVQSQALKKMSHADNAAAELTEMYCLKPTEEDDCTTDESYEECKELVREGCEMVIATFSCPPHYSCKNSSVFSEEERSEELEEIPAQSRADCPAFAGTDQTPDCLSCMENGCVWSVGKCLSSCMVIADASCWDVSHPRYADKTAVDVCAMAESDKTDRENPIDSSQCHPPSENDDCNTPDSYQECLNLVTSGCEMVISTFSCPPHHVCMASEPEENVINDDSSKQCAPPSEGNHCITEDSYKECLELANDGCDLILSTFSCPPQHSCGSNEATSAPTLSVSNAAIESHCRRPAPGDGCTTEESYRECLALEAAGCEMTLMTASCPPHYACPSLESLDDVEATAAPSIEPTMSVDEISQCHEPVEGDMCATQKSYQECLALEKAGCAMLIATMSCPPRFGCADATVTPTSGSTDSNRSNTQCRPPIEGDMCSGEASYQECLDLENDGCNIIIETASCPPRYGCGDP